MSRLTHTAPQEMVERQLKARGIRDPRILGAMAEVPREEFVPQELVEFAYEDTPLPIDEEQTISQPYVVALMLEALELDSRDTLLDVGTGSGYAAAVASRIVAQVYGIERHASLARAAAERCRRLGYTNVHVRAGDGTLGWPEHAPFQAIVVAAGGPTIPDALKTQIAIGGRLIIPIGATPRVQNLLRLRRTAADTWEQEDLGPVAFVPLIGEAGWPGSEAPPSARLAPARSVPRVLSLIRQHAEPLGDIERVNLDAFLERVGDARVVCLGEASHGTSEFYMMRARITRALIERKGFSVVALEADWPEAQQLDRYVRGTTVEPHPEQAFDRFPTWMWANQEMLDFVDQLKAHNDAEPDVSRRAGIYGLDLYSLHRSSASVIRYLDEVDPATAQIARQRYACLDPWQQDPAAYGAAVLSGRYRACEQAVVDMLTDMVRKRVTWAARDPERAFDAERNADLVARAEEYYRAMYYGTALSWNLRDQHMFDTLEAVLRHRGAGARAVVWAHNSHLGDAAWTEMSARGEYNVGQLVRSRYGEDSYLVGFGTDRGTVAAASDWGAPMEIKRVQPSHERSYERLCHDSGVESFLLPLRGGDAQLRRELMPERLERAIGVIYRPETELQSHYFHAVLPRQFDEWIWFDETRAVEPIPVEARAELPDTYPFAV